MRHLSREDLLTRLEGGALAAAAEDHLRACARCQEEVATLASTLERVRDTDVPEPSPLFWDHLASRVRAAVAGEPAPRRVASGLPGWRWWVPASGLAAAAAALVVAVATPQAPPVEAPALAAAHVPAPAAAGDPAGDAWALVVEFAATSEDTGDSATLDLGPADAEVAAAYLSDEEQATLVEVLSDELAKSRPRGES